VKIEQLELGGLMKQNITPISSLYQKEKYIFLKKQLQQNLFFFRIVQELEDWIEGYIKQNDSILKLNLSFFSFLLVFDLWTTHPKIKKKKKKKIYRCPSHSIQLTKKKNRDKEGKWSAFRVTTFISINLWTQKK